MAREVVSPHVARVVSMTTSGGMDQKRLGVRMQEYPIDHESPLVGKLLRDSGIRAEFGVIVVAVIDKAGEAHFNPGPDLELEAGGVMVCVGPGDGLASLGYHARGESPPSEEA